MPAAATVTALFERYGYLVHARCRQILGSDALADDATQEVFVRALRHAGKLEGDEALAPWFYRVATNVALNELRRQRARGGIGTHDDLDAAPLADTAALGALIEKQDLVRVALRAAPDEERAIAVGYFFDECSVEELASRHAVSVPTVRRRLRSFVRRARTLLEGGA